METEPDAEEGNQQPTRRQSPTARWLKRAVVALLFVGVATLLAPQLLRLRSVRAVILAQVAAVVESSLGVEAGADDFDLDLTARRLIVRGLVLSRPGAEKSFLRVRLTTAEFAWGELLHSPRRIRILTLGEAVWNVDAPLPSGGAEKNAATSDDPKATLAVARIFVEDSIILSEHPVLGFERWFSAWRWQSVTATGSFENGFQMQFSPAPFDLEPVEPEAGAEGRVLVPRSMMVAGSFEWDSDGNLNFKNIAVDGEGLTLRGEGSGRFGEGEHFLVEGRFDSRLGRFLDGVSAESRLVMETSLEINQMLGTLRVEGRTIPAEVLRPYLGDVGPVLALDATTFDLEADLELGGRDPAATHGTGRIVWQHGAEMLLEAQGTIAREEIASEEVRLDLEARLLPGRSDALRVRGALVTPNLEARDAIRLANLRVTIDTTDAAGLFASLDAMAPGLLASLPDEIRTGAIAGSATLNGPPGSASIEVDTLWQPTANESVTLAAKGRLLSGDGRFDLEATHLDAGRLRAGWQASVIDRARVSATSRGGRIAIEAAEIEVGSRRASLRGNIDLDVHRGWSVARLRSADLAIEAEEPRTGIDWITGQLRLSEGVLIASSFEGETDAGRFKIEGRLPLAGLAAWPVWQPLTGRVTRLAEGRAQLTIGIPGFSSAEWLSLLGQPSRSLAVSGDLDSHLDLDLSSPTSGGGRLFLEDAALSFGDLQLRAIEPLRITLESGQVELQHVDLHGQGVSLAVSGTTAIDTTWKPGTDLLAAIEPIHLSVLTVPGASAESPRITWQAVAETFGIDPGQIAATADLAMEVDFYPGHTEASTARLTLGQVEGTFRGLDIAADDVELTLADGFLRLAPTRVAAAEQGFMVSAESPVNLTANSGGSLADWLGPVVIKLAAGPAVLGIGALPLRPGRLFELLSAKAVAASPEPIGSPGLTPIGASSSTSLEARLQLDLRAPMDSQGEMRLIDMVIESGDKRLSAREDIVVQLSERRLSLGPVRFDGPGTQAPFVMSATADLAAGWPQEADLSNLLEAMSVRISGTLPAGIFDPYLAAYLGGASARGSLHLDVAIDGPPGRMRGRARLNAPGARVLVARPYFAQVEDIHLDLALREGGIEIVEGMAKLNQGPIRLSGALAPNGDLALSADFDDVRMRVDYGLTMLLDGRLNYTQPAQSRTALLAGKLVVERGQVRRYLDPDRELLARLFGTESAGSSSSPTLRGITLDIDLRTQDGIRIKNNLADLRATWSRLEVSGSLAEPVVRGRIDTDPQGYIYAYGQAMRLDRGSLTFLGDPDLAPELDFVVTTASEDPAIGREGFSRFPAALRPDSQTSRSTETKLPSGIADYYLSRLAGQLGSLGSVDIAIGEDFLIFGEADPSRRLTIRRDLSTNVSLATSFDLSEEGDKTYVLDLHDFAFADSLAAQIFTTDDEDLGATLQQVFELGRPPGDARLPRLRGFEIEAPEALRRSIRRALSSVKGDRVEASTDFDIAIDLAEHLRRSGYPGAEIDVRFREVKRQGAVAQITVDPGPQVRYVFEGDRPPASARRAVRTIYRPDLYEPATLDEIAIETSRALRAEGYLEPSVQVLVEVEDDSDKPASSRVVIVRSNGGHKSKLGEPSFVGVAGDVQAALGAHFNDSLSRAGLLANQPEARTAVEEALADLGFPAARVEASRPESGRPVIQIAPGPRQTVNSVRIVGLTESEAVDLLPRLELAAGEPARRDRIASAGARLERLLREQGRAAARVRSEIAPADSSEHRLDVVLKAENTEIYRVDDVVFEGLRATRRGWAERAAGLEKGVLIQNSTISDARRSLYEIGVFSAVVPSTELRDDGTGVITFDLQERARYRFAFGGRWASSQGLATVVDVVDRNGFGRGIRLGVRARYAGDDESARFFGSVPNAFGTQATLDLFVEGRQERTGELSTSRVESTLQVSVPHGERTTSRYYVRYIDESVSNVGADLEAGEADADSRFKLPVFGFQWLRDSRDDRIEPRRGTFLSADLSATDKSLSSDLSFLRLLARVNHFRTAGRFRGRPIVWAQSLRVGLAEAFDNTSLLREERFFAGGEFSVRGYAEDSLGPLDSAVNGFEALGGEALFVVNQELRVPMTKMFRGVVFFDSGNVYSDLSDLGSDLFNSIGVGLRARTPIGILRSDMAFPLNRRDEDEEFEIYLGFGFSF